MTLYPDRGIYIYINISHNIYTTNITMIKFTIQNEFQ